MMATIITTVALVDGKRRRPLTTLLRRGLLEARGRAGTVHVLILMTSACVLVVGPRMIQWLLTVEINNILLVEATEELLLVLPWGQAQSLVSALPEVLLSYGLIAVRCLNRLDVCPLVHSG